MADGFDNQQIIVTGRVKPTSVNTEVITFTINLALFKIICIVNIPENGNEAPVYIKFRLNERRPRQQLPYEGDDSPVRHDDHSVVGGGIGHDD